MHTPGEKKNFGGCPGGHPPADRSDGCSLVGWVEERNSTFTDVDKRQYDLHTCTKSVGFREAQPNLLCFLRSIFALRGSDIHSSGQRR